MRIFHENPDPGQEVVKFQVTIELYDADNVSCRLIEIRASNAGGQGSIPGHGTRSHILHLRACMLK